MATALQGAASMTIRRSLLLVILAAGLATASLGASFIVPSDREFARRAPVIVVATALSSRTELDNDRIVTITTMSVEEVIKGDVADQTIDIYEPGGRYKDRATIISGTPRFDEGERSLLFVSRARGHWVVVDLMIGTFNFAPDVLGLA